MSDQEEQESKKRERTSKVVCNAKMMGEDTTLLIVDCRKAKPNEKVCYVARWGKILQKGEKPTKEHYFKVKTFENKKTRKVFTMTRNAKGKFKMLNRQ
jgi:hypothetical protein